MNPLLLCHMVVMVTVVIGVIIILLCVAFLSGEEWEEWNYQLLAFINLSLGFYFSL